MDLKKPSRFEKIANNITLWTGSSWAFGIAAATIFVWLISGAIFGFSDTWQLVINTGTTIVTFLMVFLIQKTQNKDGKAIQIKLNELIAASKMASNRIVDIEDLTEEELDTLHKFYQRIAENAEKEGDLHHSHSIGSADDLHQQKSNYSKKDANDD